MQSIRKRSVGSTTSTTCSTPPPHDIYSVLLSEESRYKRKGYGLIFASLIWLSFMLISPIAIQNLWPPFMDLVKSQGWEKWQVYYYVSLAWHSLMIIITNLAMWAIYEIQLPFFERYKISTDPWPWVENKGEWMKMLKKSIALVSFNNFVSLPITIYAFLWLKNFQVDLQFGVENLPGSMTIMFTLAFCMICEDLTFHLIHRFLHWRVIYPYFHKVHHQYRTTIGIAAEYSHPIDFIIGSVIPGSVGAMILGDNMHFTTYLVWVMVRLGESLDGHSGYEFSWSPYRLIPFSTSASYHNFHHSHNIGNYSSFFSLWDTIFGQNKVFYQFMEKVKEAKEAHQKQQEEFNKKLNEKLSLEQRNEKLLKQD
ncbi:sterol desaturase family protein [Stylonychia lemnae]|uniref:Sterol desaturase family protein n=1 Tax=Stylonychia lemnae TaxID=5949 RepID=A0A077ZX38_STYLE|nr:sterol desaturase family protein [Stylonychia lemnae]|eukprot:CDW73081.1 sterol desaturase family protein [Stylonychia lemnae]